MFKKIFSSLILLIVVGGVGYSVYTTKINPEANVIVAEDTGVLADEEVERLAMISETEEGVESEEFKAMIAKLEEVSKYRQDFNSWNQLDSYEESGAYYLPKNPFEPMYLLSAIKKSDGKIIGYFSDQPMETIE